MKNKNLFLLITLLYFSFFNIAFCIDRGKILAHVSGCYGCHTTDKETPFSGGYKIKTKYGTFISPNITFHKEYGIGNWNLKQFTDAVKHGINPDGKPYYPVFPYNWYNNLKKDDISQIYNYLKSITIQSVKQEEHELYFPFNIRELLTVRKLIRERFYSYKQIKFNNEEIKLGYYIIQSQAHCGACHSPRTFLSIVKDINNLEGRPKSNKNINDSAPDISNNKEKGIGNWDNDDIVFFLQSGFKPNGDYVEGHMSGIIEFGTSFLSENELQAVANYLLSKHNK